MANPIDDDQICTAVAAVPQWGGVADVTYEPLVGGLMNSNWLVTRGDQRFVLKLFGEGSESFVDRELSNIALRQAHAVGISPGVIHFDREHRAEFVEFLAGYRASVSADFLRSDFRHAVMGLYKAFNGTPQLPVTKTVFEMTDEHIVQGDALGAIRPSDFPALLLQYERAKAAFAASGLDLAPCHNDPMPGNFMVQMSGHDRIDDMKLIDFEFASNNERAYEIGVFLGEVFVDETASLELIESYYGTARPDHVARVTVARAVADMKWGSWAVQRRKLSDWDFDFQKYGIWKYARARRLFNDPRWDEWLHTI